MVNFLITEYNSVFYHLKYTPSFEKPISKYKRLKMWSSDNYNGNDSGNNSDNGNDSGNNSMTIGVTSLFLQILAK